MSKLIKTLILCVALTFTASQALAFPGAGGQAPGAQPAANAPVPIDGKVVQTMNSGGYTYVCLEKDGKYAWAAMPTTEVQVGDQVAVARMVMRNFTSKTLNRTFDAIVFSQGLVKQ